MSVKRQAQMASIKAKLELEEKLKQQAQNDPELSNLAPEDRLHAEELKKGDLATTLEINRLKRAKAAATTKDIKDKFQAEIDEAILRRDEEKARQKEQAETIKHATGVVDVGTKIYNDAKNQVDGVVERGQAAVAGGASWLETKSIPGSIWLPITTLMIFFFFLLPINGKTRAEWLFEAIVGQSSIKNPNYGGGSVGDFGEGMPPVPIRTFTAPGGNTF